MLVQAAAAAWESRGRGDVRMRSSALVIASLVLLPLAASGGILDQLVKEAKRAVDDVVQEESPPATPDQPSAAQQDPAPPSGAAAEVAGASPGAPGAPTPAATELALLHYAPEMIDADIALEHSVRIVYPGEADILDPGNEFEWNRRKDEYRKRLLQAAADATVTFAMTPWPESNRYPRMQLGAYDFSRNGFPVASFGVRQNLKVLVGNRPFFKWAGEDPDAVRFLPLPAGRAEALFAGQPIRVLYPKFSYTITRVDKESHSRNADAPRNWQPTVAIDSMELYAKKVGGQARSAADFEHVTTLDLSGKR